MDPFQLTPLSMDGAVFLQTAQDEVDENTTYVGYAVPAAGTNEAKWMIAKVVKTGNVTTKRFADASCTFGKVWDNRATYTY